MSDVTTDHGVEDLLWMVIVGGIACFTMGFGIGANDVANNFGSSVGSGAIKFGYAILIAAVFELFGAMALGSSVTDAVRKGIIDTEAFVDMPDILMFMNFCALIAGTLWLIGASAFGYPVSTTHTIIGALFGVGLATGIPGIIDYKYLGSIVLSWFSSPVLSCFLGMLLFALVRHFILRKENALYVVKHSLWILDFFLFSVFTCFFVFKNPLFKDYAGDYPGASFGICMGIGLGLCLIFTPLLQWMIARKLNKNPLSLQTDIGTPSTSEALIIARPRTCTSRSDDSSASSSISLKETSFAHASTRTAQASATQALDTSNSDVELYAKSQSHVKLSAESIFDADSDADLQCTDRVKKKWYNMPWFMDLHKEALSNDLKAATVHDKSEKFTHEVESYFSYLQVISACVSCTVHGANDVANATAPFSTVYGIYQAGEFQPEVPTPLWILGLGGLAIGVGVMFLGHKVIQSIGIKLVKITPARGFCIEISMATIMVIGSMLGIPLSTTHCQVGSTVGVGLIDKHENQTLGRRNCGIFNWKAVNCTLIGKILISWVATIVISALLGATIFAFGVYSPSL